MSSEVVHRANPATIGIIIECLARGGGALIGLAWLIGSLAAAGFANATDDSNLILAAVALLGGLSTGCDPEVDKPTPPDMSFLVATYAAPDGELNGDTVLRHGKCHQRSHGAYIF